ncbi:ArsR family transcriptional regulator [Methanoregula sp.]|uniref:ArsR family transcriptional regulator n=1 Tax=Methanoregula sp. TaxID=2052170 RepID=UPI002B73C8D8|nr:ArsR family transcriptional regulator [Methanoregula sp.]HVP96032.1 ArsR family transcriptional regulator [Methanoregula sp.]
MRSENVMYFTDKEEAFANLLIEIGTKKCVAKVLVFLANTPQATSRDIERGTDLRQPEVSLAMHYLKDQSWITAREIKSESKGRPVKIYELARPIADIMDSIEKEKHKEAANQLEMIQKLRTFIA